jgi:hypothetical protein
MVSIFSSICTVRRGPLIALACTAMLAACGGGSGSAAPAAAAPAQAAVNAVPVAADQSVGALVAWASTLPDSETGQPLRTDAFTPPVSETMQPVDVN